MHPSIRPSVSTLHVLGRSSCNQSLSVFMRSPVREANLDTGSHSCLVLGSREDIQSLKSSVCLLSAYVRWTREPVVNAISPVPSSASTPGRIRFQCVAKNLEKGKQSFSETHRWHRGKLMIQSNLLIYYNCRMLVLRGGCPCQNLCTSSAFVKVDSPAKTDQED